jgi:cytidine deaminase
MGSGTGWTDCVVGIVPVAGAPREEQNAIGYPLGTFPWGRHTFAHVDWERLTAEAVGAAERAYAPYSGYPVGVAGLVDDGRLVTGCNVENASYGLGLCAECGMVSQLISTGGGRLTHVVCVNGQQAVIMPCGRCRQLLWEHGGPQLLLMTPDGVRPMREVLPDAFGSQDLDAALTGRAELEPGD